MSSNSYLQLWSVHKIGNWINSIKAIQIGTISKCVYLNHRYI